MKRRLFLLSGLALAGCGSDPALYLVEPPAPAKAVRIAVSSIEVKDTTLPSYAEASEIAYESEDGSVRTVADTLWADDPTRAFTSSLVSHLSRATTARVAAEPWPLETWPQAELTVRVDKMLARANGNFQLSGQFALSSPDGVISDRMRSFDIQVPLTGEGSPAIANATGRAIAQLGAEIIAAL